MAGQEGELKILQRLPGKTLCISVFLAVFVMAMVFALYTQHAWEDYYITYRVSKNLASGNGLVYTPGQRIHAFTSPLGVLVPGVLCMVTGNSSDALVLWLFRVVSAIALAGAAVLLLLVGRRLSLGRIPMLFLVGMFAFDAKIVDFSINGMETGLLMFFMALTLHSMVGSDRFVSVRLGFAWAGLMWTRPDSFVYIGALAAGMVLFKAGPEPARDRRHLIVLLARAGAVASALYVAWLLWAWSYYGTPVPHTVIAKGLARHRSAGELLSALGLYPLLSVFYRGSYAAMFLPPYAVGGWPDWLSLWSRALAWPSAIAWIVPRLHPSIRASSLALMVAGFYLDEVSPFPYPWYLPSCTLLSILVLSGVLQLAVDLLPRRKTSALLARTFIAVALLASASLSVLAAYQLRIQQSVIEEGNRKQIGLWLARNSTSASDTVFLEPLGYIGFYSQLKMLDFPGLCAPEVVAARKKLGSDSAGGLIQELKPNWLVLRAAEADRIRSNSPAVFEGMYKPVRTFDVSEAVRAHRWLPGRDYLVGDQTFIVFRRCN